MDIREITKKEHQQYNALVQHPLQSYEWGAFREKTGVKVLRYGIYKNNVLTENFQMTLHKVPKINKYIGYLPKAMLPTQALINELKKIGERENCIFIQLEPNVTKEQGEEYMQKLLQEKSFSLVPAAHPLFTKYTFLLDLTQPKDILLKNMHPKTRYNIKVAQKHNVSVTEDNSPEAFAAYWQLTEETTKRQQFFAHTKHYHQLQWELFPHTPGNYLSSHLFVARYQGKILTTMLFFLFHNTLYYPYGASSNEARQVMHSTLTMWEGITFGQKHKATTLDMWGAMGENPDKNDPWFGFHEFKRKYGPKHVSFVGSYDLVIDKTLYQGFKLADKLRWLYLRMRR